MKDRIQDIVKAAIASKTRLLEDAELLERIHQATKSLISAFQAGNQVLFCGNGGSAADAQHIAAELSGRFLKERAPLNAEALHVNSSYMTAVANDYSFGRVYERAVQAKGRKGDVLVAISTSGNSENILRAIEAAKTIGMPVIGMTGETGGQMATQCDILLNMPAQETARIQEMHIMVGHILCELIENELFPG